MSFTLNQFNEKFQKQIRAQLAPPPLASVPAQGAQSMQWGEGEDCRMETATANVGVRVTFVQFRRRLLDGHDNLQFSLKPTTDRITAWLGFRSDSDPRLTWNYHQVQTRDEEGVLVKIDMRKEHP